MAAAVGARLAAGTGAAADRSEFQALELARGVVVVAASHFTISTSIWWAASTIFFFKADSAVVCPFTSSCTLSPALVT